MVGCQAREQCTSPFTIIRHYDMAKCLFSRHRTKVGDPVFRARMQVFGSEERECEVDLEASAFQAIIIIMTKVRCNTGNDVRSSCSGVPQRWQALFQNLTAAIPCV